MKPSELSARPHIALDVADLAASVAFYSDLFGTSPDKLRPEYARFRLAEPPLVLALNLTPDCAPGGRVSHFGVCVETPRELLATRARLRAAGHELREEAATTCCYAVQDKFWVTDPDGHDWEFYRVLADAERYSAEAAETAVCCVPPADRGSRV